MHKIFSSKEEVDMVNIECRRAGIGCVECKRLFAKNLNENLAPFRDQRAELDKHPDTIWDILDEGARKMRLIAEKTMSEVRDAVGLP
jgi:tryptophanyl-tRNA synthetase